MGAGWVDTKSVEELVAALRNIHIHTTPGLPQFRVHLNLAGKYSSIEIVAMGDSEASSEGGTSLYIAKVKSGTGDTYTVDVYSDYEAGTKVAEDVTLKILQIDAGETVPADTLYPCWEMSWSGTTYWTAYAPVIR